MSPDSFDQDKSDAVAGVKKVMQREALRQLVLGLIVAVCILAVGGLIGGWVLYEETNHNTRAIATSAASDELDRKTREQEHQQTQEQIKTLRAQVIAINAKRKEAGLPPVKTISPEITNDAPGSQSTKENAQLVARLAAALIPAPKDGKDGKPGEKGEKGDTGKTGPAGVSVTRISFVGCTLALGTSDGKSYAGNVCGPPGPQGIQGVPGEAGASAYAIWLAAGHTGTVQDFLDSLKGQDGRGVAAVGTTGKDATGCQRLTIQYTGDTEATPIGDPVCDGAPGKDGKDGQDGSPAQVETYHYADGSVQTCTRRADSPDTAPEYDCAITSGPTNPVEPSSPPPS